MDMKASTICSMWRQALESAPTQTLSREEVAARAYQKHLAHPTLADRALQDWLDAERELLTELER
jgi:hypothetical protein